VAPPGNQAATEKTNINLYHSEEKKRAWGSNLQNSIKHKEVSSIWRKGDGSIFWNRKFKINRTVPFITPHAL
jgi:hypothetical protein